MSPDTPDSSRGSPLDGELVVETVPTIPPPKPRRKILVVADRSQECRLALRFAGRRALATASVVSLLSVVSPADFQHWMAVEEVMREEGRQEAVSLLHELAGELNRTTGLIPELIVREGKVWEQLLRTIEDDPQVRVLVLGSATGKEGPGPLVAAILGGSANAGVFPIPVTLVPGNLSPEEVDEIA